MRIIARDCCPLQPLPTADEAQWLRRLATSVRASDLVIPFADVHDDEPMVYCAWDGSWWARRYVGSLSFEGHRLTIEPRFGLATLRNWLFEATSVVLMESPGQSRRDESFIVQLLATVWAHGFVEAARHGLPALRRDVATKSSTIRGRLHIRSSLRLLASGGGGVVLVRSERSLVHAASDAIVSAYGVLRRWLHNEMWLPQRAKELLPHLIAVTGSQPRVPAKAELERIRYTPITADFASVAELSRQFANRRGLSADIEANGETKGVLLDVAELWEMYVLSVLRKAATPIIVKHGTRERMKSRKLLRSNVSGKEIGTLITEAILFHLGEVRGIVDAKYKSIHPSANAPQGAQREDLYQIAAYLGHYAPNTTRSTLGVFAYPHDPATATVPFAESHSPWTLANGKKMLFVALLHEPAKATGKLREIFR